MITPCRYHPDYVSTHEPKTPCVHCWALRIISHHLNLDDTEYAVRNVITALLAFGHQFNRAMVQSDEKLKAQRKDKPENA